MNKIIFKQILEADSLNHRLIKTSKLIRTFFLFLFLLDAASGIIDDEVDGTTSSSPTLNGDTASGVDGHKRIMYIGDHKNKIYRRNTRH